MTLDFSLRFLIVLGSILVPFWPPKWAPGGAPILRESAGWGSKTVPRSSWFGPFFVLSFGIAFLVVLGSSWGRFWSSWAPLRVVFGRSGGRFGAFSAFQLIDSTRQLINSSIQLINSSTHGPSALSYPARRTARCAIKSAATRRVGACLDSFRNSCQFLTIKPGHAQSAGL